jgi:hypothetical protein
VALLCGLTVVLFPGCGSKVQPPPVTPEVPPAKDRPNLEGVQIPTVRFTDITAKAGIHFVHTSGAFGKKLLPETMGGGVAFIDYDGDGYQDILFINSRYWPGCAAARNPRSQEELDKQPTLALYRNKHDGTFEDVTNIVHLEVCMYGMGVAVGDYDNDGWPDIFVSGVGGNRLFHNEPAPNGGRWFVDVTNKAGVVGPDPYPWTATASGDFLKLRTPLSFPSSATFLDYDGDGLLDLFVCYYVTWSPGYDLGQPFQLTGGGRAFGPPTAFEGAQCVLYRNLGNGTFEDVSAKAGIQVFEKEGVGEQARRRSISKSLGVIVCDVDNDGWPDIIVANDTVRNFFFHNKGDGTFEEVGQLSGIAFADGKARGAMGIDWGEYRPGRYGVILANFADEPITFLRLDNRQQLLFSDVATAEGLYGPSRLPLKFGAFFFDYDLDGRLDLLTCNGHLEPDISTVQASQAYEQAAHLYWNTGGRVTYAPVSDREAGPDLFRPMVGRGCAFASIQNDGNLDVVLVANGGPARLLKNQGGSGNNWVRLVLEGDGRRSNRSAIGARVTVEAGGKVQHHHIAGARGYLSQCELPLTVGLGKATKIDRVVIQWPGKNGRTEEWTGLAINQTHQIKQGQPKIGL